MRWLVALALLVTTSCAAGRPMAPQAPPVVSSAPPATTSAAPAVSHASVTRREQPYPRIQGATLVTEVEGEHCSVGLEAPIGPGMISTKSGVWLVMPRSACEGDPDVHRTTGFVLWRGAGFTSVEDTSPEDRASALTVPIEFLPPREGLAIARSLLDALPPLPMTARSRHRLEILDDDGRVIGDRAQLLRLCDRENPDACLVAASGAPDRERRSLLERSCRLGDDDGCYALGLDLRARALEAIHRTPEVRDLLDFTCGMGRRTNLTLVLVNEAARCPPAAAVAK